MKPVAELIAVPGKSFPALVFADGFRDLPAGTKLYASQDQDAIDAQRYRHIRNIESQGFINSKEYDERIDAVIAACATKEK